jgi:DNA-binding transcriptional LysR family regulator
VIEDVDQHRQVGPDCRPDFQVRHKTLGSVDREQNSDTISGIRHNVIASGYSEMYRGSLDWDDARLFLAVAREGSLRGAARKLGISQPTVGRRLARFEASASAVPLFDRFPEGLRLTLAGKSALPLAERLEVAALALQGQRAAAGPQPSSVRISVGEWAGDFLAQCLGGADRQRLPDGVAIELVASDQTINLTRREADLAVRHGRPETGDLYVSRVGTIACAAYGAPGTQANAVPWITYAQEQAHYALSRWIAATVKADDANPSIRASTMSMQAATARTGGGVAVLPCYLGDRDPALVRMLGRIEQLDAPQWLIVHRDLRRLPIIRAVMDWVVHVFAANRSRLEGCETETPSHRPEATSND